MNENHSHPLISFILWLNGLIMYLFSVATVDNIYIWIFRALSIISLVLVIGVNYEKGIKGIKKIFKK